MAAYLEFFHDKSSPASSPSPSSSSPSSLSSTSEGEEEEESSYRRITSSLLARRSRAISGLLRPHLRRKTHITGVGQWSISAERVNTNNHWQLLPFFVLGGVVHAEERFWLTFTAWRQPPLLYSLFSRGGARARYVHLYSGKNVLQSERWRAAKAPFDALCSVGEKGYDNLEGLDRDLFFTVYRAYYRSFSVDNFVKTLRAFLPPYHFASLSSRDAFFLAEATRARLKLAQASRGSYAAFAESALCKKLAHFFHSYVGGAFVKTGKTSGKNDKQLKPLYDLEAVFDRLTSCAAFLREWEACLEGEAVVVCVAPWDYALHTDREFRVIVHERRVVAVSQQKWFLKACPALASEPETFLAAILDACDGICEALPYPHAVMDMWVDECFVAHLIEVNPGEGWASSGSSLFHWLRDADVLQGKRFEEEGPHFRFVN